MSHAPLFFGICSGFGRAFSTSLQRVVLLQPPGFLHVKEPMSSTQTVPPRDEKQEMDEDGASGLNDSSQQESSDADEKSKGAKLAKKKRGKAKAKEMSKRAKLAKKKKGKSKVKEKSKGARLAKKKRRKAKDVKAKGGSSGLERLEDSREDKERNAASLAKKKRGNSKVLKKGETPCVEVERRWNKLEKAAVQRQLGSFVTQCKIPRKEHCIKCVRKEKNLSDRSWKDVRNLVHKAIIVLNHSSAARKLSFTTKDSDLC